MATPKAAGAGVAVAPEQTVGSWEIMLREDETTGRKVAVCPEPGCEAVRVRNTTTATAEAIAEHLIVVHVAPKVGH